MAATRCDHCGALIQNSVSMVSHGGRVYCCANCSAAMEATGSGSDPKALGHADALRCAHCDVPIVDESTLESRGDQAFCCANCAGAM